MKKIVLMLTIGLLGTLPNILKAAITPVNEESENVNGASENEDSNVTPCVMPYEDPATGEPVDYRKGKSPYGHCWERRGYGSQIPDDQYYHRCGTKNPDKKNTDCKGKGCPTNGSKYHTLPIEIEENTTQAEETTSLE